MDSNAEQYTVYYLKQKQLDEQVAALNMQRRRDDAMRAVQARDSARDRAKLWLGMIDGPAVQASLMYADLKKFPLFDKVYRLAGYTRARPLLQGKTGIDPDLQYLDHNDASAESLQHQITDVAAEVRRATAQKDAQIAELQSQAQVSDKLAADLRAELNSSLLSQSLMKGELAAAISQTSPAGRRAIAAPLAILVSHYNSLLHKIANDQAADLTPHVSDDAARAAALHDTIAANPLFVSEFHETSALQIAGGGPELHFIAAK